MNTCMLSCADIERILRSISEKVRQFQEEDIKRDRDQRLKRDSPPAVVKQQPPAQQQQPKPDAGKPQLRFCINLLIPFLLSVISPVICRIQFSAIWRVYYNL